jgi:flagellar FliL protein
MSDLVEDAAGPAKKKKGKGKLIMFTLLGLILVGGGTAGGLFAAGVGPFKHPGEAIAAITGPRLVPKSEQKRIGLGTGEGGGAGASKPGSTGGERYASNYYAMEKEFTSNLQDSVHFVQVGIAISTPYDDTVIENIKTNEIAVRSAVLMTLSDTSEEQIFSTDGKKQLETRLAQAINAVLKEKEGFGGVGNVYFTNFIVQ